MMFVIGRSRPLWAMTFVIAEAGTSAPTARHRHRRDWEDSGAEGQAPCPPTLPGELGKTRSYGCCAGTIPIGAPTSDGRGLVADGGQAEETRAGRRHAPVRRRRRRGLQHRA